MMAKFNFCCGRDNFFFGIRFCSAILFSQVPKKCTDLDLSLLYNLILGTHSEFARQNGFLSSCGTGHSLAYFEGMGMGE